MTILTPQEAAWVATAIPLPISTSQIQTQVCAVYNKRVTDIIAPNRRADLVEVRSIAIFMVRKITRRAWKDIGRRFGGRDHATVIHAYRKIEARVAADRVFAAEMAGLQAKIEGATQ